MAHTIFRGRVTDEQNNPIHNAEIDYLNADGSPSGQRAFSNPDGNFELRVDYEDAGPTYQLRATAFGAPAETQPADEKQREQIYFRLQIGLQISLNSYGDGGTINSTDRAVAGKRLILKATSKVDPRIGAYDWRIPPQAQGAQFGREVELVLSQPGTYSAAVRIHDNQLNEAGQKAAVTTQQVFEVGPADLQMVSGNVQSDVRGELNVKLHRAAFEPTLDQALWDAIKNRTHAISFIEYRRFMDRVLFGRDESEAARPHELDIPLGVEAYRALKYVTEAFLLRQSGVFIGDNRSDQFALHGDSWRHEIRKRLSEYLGEPPRLPYFRTVIEDAFPWLEGRRSIHDHVLLEHIDRPPMIELIHTYWLEEGMLMQTINAIAQRFQNVHSRADRDPLANFELDPLRRISNWLWGFIQDEPNRLTVKRRAFEYLHQYGLPLYGKAVQGLRPADTRSKFIEAFHNLLHQAYVFYKQDDQTTIIADAYPLLNSLKEVHLILAQAAGNQFNDARWATRVETLLVQFILSQPAMRDFLQGRPMVPYQEPWMPQVDAMKTLQGWSDVTVTHFRNLAVYGEQIVLSVRFGNWIDIQNADHAAHWAREFRSAIQSYISAYRAVTGVDLTTSEKVDAVPPGVHLQHRLAIQQRAR
jgi:hypothetical protein